MIRLKPLALRSRHVLCHPNVALRRLREGKRGFQEPPWGLIESLLGPTPLVLEAGAADGADTVKLAALRNGLIHVIAVEPVPAAFARLARATAHLSNVQLVRGALGPESGTAAMWESDGQGGSDSSSLLDPKKHGKFFSGVHFSSQIQVQTSTIDDLLYRLGIPRVDFMWLDLQGLELDVLTASPGTRSSVNAVYMEVSRHELYRGSPTYSQVLQQMTEWGFTAIHDRVGAVSGNVLFSRSSA